MFDPLMNQNELVITPTCYYRKGNDLNFITMAWTCGYVIGQIPSKYALHSDRRIELSA